MADKIGANTQLLVGAPSDNGISCFNETRRLIKEAGEKIENIWNTGTSGVRFYTPDTGTIRMRRGKNEIYDFVLLKDGSIAVHGCLSSSNMGS